MEYGHVVLANSKQEFTARMIKLLTRSQWSHSLVTSAPQLGVEMGMEAAGSGVSQLPFDKAYRQDPGQGFRVYRINLAQDVKDSALRSILPELESPYGYADLPWFIWRAINRLFGRDIKSQNNWASKNDICSQLVVKYLTACGLSALFAGYGVNTIAPQDLQEIMDAHPETFQVIENKE